MATDFTMTYTLTLFVEHSKEPDANVAANTKAIIKANLHEAVKNVNQSLGNTFVRLSGISETET